MNAHHRERRARARAVPKRTVAAGVALPTAAAEIVTTYSPQVIAGIHQPLDRAVEAELDRMAFANPAHREARYSAGVVGVEGGWQSAPPPSPYPPTCVALTMAVAARRISVDF